jgi:hypothetical protein
MQVNISRDQHATASGSFNDELLSSQILGYEWQDDYKR